MLVRQAFRLLSHHSPAQQQLLTKAVEAGSGPAHKHFWTSQASALLAAPSWATHSRQQLGSWGSLLAEPCSASLQAAAKRIHSHAHLAGRSMLSGHGRQPGQLSRQQQAFSQPAGRRSSNSSSSSSHNTARTSEQSTTKGAVAAVASKQSASAAVGLPAAAQPATPTLMTSVRSVLSPAEVYQQAVNMGVAKANGAFATTFLSAILAGAYVGFGAMLALSIGQNCPGLAESNPGLQKMIYGAFGLPVGLLMVLICGAELFTSNAAMLPAALYEGRVTMAQLLRNWGIAYTGNMVGALMLVGLAVLAGVFAASPEGAIYIAEYKTSHSFAETFGRGVLCNWLVCLAVWQATAASSVGGKAIAVWFPISAFVAMGLEHSVANMMLVPMGMAMGADVTASEFLLKNLLPVTLGNIVAGSIFVGGAYSCIYGTLLKRLLAVKR